MSNKTKANLDPTARYLSEQLAVIDRFGGSITHMMIRPDPSGKILSHAQDPQGFIVIRSQSLQELDIPHSARLDNLGYLRSIMDIMHKEGAQGRTAKLEFESKMAVDQKTTVIKRIRFEVARTEYLFQASDPFLHKTVVKTERNHEWPAQFHLEQTAIDRFEDAARTHMAGSIKAEGNDHFTMHVAENGEVHARFKSRSGEINCFLQKFDNSEKFTSNEAYPIHLFRSVLTSSGPDGLIVRVSPLGLSLETETHIALYTFVMTRKILPQGNQGA